MGMDHRSHSTRRGYEKTQSVYAQVLPIIRRAELYGAATERDVRHAKWNTERTQEL